MYFNSLKNIVWCATLSAPLILTSCESKQNASTPNASVNPFDTTHLEAQALSADDRAKLAAATGRTAVATTEDDLAQRILQSTDKLHVYCFWNMQNEGSVSTIKALQQLSNNYDSTQLKVVFVSIMEQKRLEDVTLFIRENQLSDEAVLLDKADWVFFSKKLKKNLSDISTLPVILMVNKSEEVFQFYNKPMDDKELTALVQPVL